LNEVVKKDEMGRACSTNREKRKACTLLLGKSVGKRPRGCEDNIKMNLGEIY
jgi:hypothetical protein